MIEHIKSVTWQKLTIAFYDILKIALLIYPSADKIAQEITGNKR